MAKRKRPKQKQQAPTGHVLMPGERRESAAGTWVTVEEWLPSLGVVRFRFGDLPGAFKMPVTKFLAKFPKVL